MKKDKIKKTILITLLCLIVVFVMAGTGLVIYKYVSDNVSSSQPNHGDNDGWTNNY